MEKRPKEPRFIDVMIVPNPRYERELKMTRRL